MAEYHSNYTGPQIDAGIAKANTAAQPADLANKQNIIDASHKLSADLVDDTSTTNKFVTASDKTAWNGKQDALVSGTNIKTINNESLLGSGNINIEGGGSDVSVREIDYSNPEEWDSEEQRPTAEVIDDILANKYTLIHVYNIEIDEDVLVEMYLVASGMIDVEESGAARYYYKFDEGNEDEGTPPNIEQYLFIHQEGESAQMIVENFELGGEDASWGSITGTLSNQTDLQNALDSKQASLVSGTNIKTINNESLLGSGNITISSSYTPPVYTPTDIDFETYVIDFSSADYAEIFNNKPPIIGLSIGDQVIQMQQAIDDSDANTIQYAGIVSTTDVSQVAWMQLENDNGSYSGNIYSVDIASVDQVDAKQDVIDSSHKLSADLVDDTSTTNKFVTASDKTTWSGKQDALVSGTNIKTVNNQSIVGSGNIAIETSDIVLDSNLVGKKLSLIGDSITTYSGWLPSGNVTRYPRGAITSVEQTWWKKLLNETGMVIGQNCAWDGSTCSGLSTSTTNAYAACSDKRITQLGLNGTPDIIICYIGINDWGATYNKNHTQYGGSFVDGAFVPIGNYTGETALPSGELKTLSEAYGAMVGKIQIAYPLAKIYCCTLPQTNGKATYNYDADGVFPSVNRDGVSIADYNDCIRMIAKNLGAEVIEFAECGINWGNMTTYMEDGLHPMPDGMTLLCDTAKAKLYSDFGVSVHGGSPTPPTTTYTVTNNLTHVTTNNSATSVVADASYIATLTPDSTYNLQSVSVEMGGVDITSTAYSNGTISIVNVTGNLVITATATAQASYSVTNNLTNVTTSNNTASVVENDPYTATLSPSLHYTMGTVTVTMGGTDITSTAYDDGVITIASVTGNLVITATANAITYTVTNTLSHATNSNSDTSVIEGSGYTGTITADLGYTLDTVTITMGGTDITSTAYSNGTINIVSVTGNIVITVTAVAGLTWYTNFAQTSTSSFVASSRGWALDEETYANIYGKPINKISFVATASSGSMDFCIAPSKDAQSGFTNAQTINWTSANKSGNIVTIDIPEFTLANGTYLCVYVNTTPGTGVACYAMGGNAGQFYSYVGAASHSTWGGKGSYSIQMNLGYEPSSNS